MSVGLGDEQLWLSATNDNSGTSTAFNDQSGNGNNGTAIGTLVVADTSNGGTYAYDFDGTDDYVSIPDSPSLRIDNPSGISICAWIKPDTVSGGDSFSSTNPRYIIKKGVLPDSFNYGLRLLGGKVGFTYRNSTDTAYTACIQDVASVVAGSWQHVAVSGSSSGYKIYVNGSEVASTQSGTLTDSPIQNSNSCELGRQDTTQRMFDGLQDDIRLYDRVLTPAEIVRLAGARGIEGPAPVGLGDEQLWLCPSLSDSALDISGNGNNGTLAGGTAVVSDTGSGGTKSFETYTTSTDKVTIPVGVLSDNSDVALSVWVKNKQTSAGTKVRNIVRTVNDDFKLYAYQTNYIGNAGAVTATDSVGALNTTEYYHYALNYTYATGSIELFRNGVSIGSATGVGAITVSGAMDILQNSFAYADDIRAYDRALTQAEITYLATSRGIEGGPDTPPAGGFYNPFLSHTFHTLIGQRIR